MEKNKTLTIFDLFSGIGGFRLAAERVFPQKGISPKIVAFSEIDSEAVKTYRSNFQTDNEKYIPDITELDNNDAKIISEVPDHDILFAGFPCQSFSMMGEQKGFMDPRGTLFFYIEKILEIKKPSFFLLENVQRIKTIDSKNVFNTIMHSLEKKLGYDVFVWVLNSADYGVPQTRRRVYFLGVKKGIKIKGSLNEPPDPFYQKKTDVKNILEKEVDPKYYLSERIKKTILSNGSGKFYSKSEINMTPARPLTKTMHKMHRACQDNYYSDFYLKGGSKDSIRRITPIEAFRLQGFPDSFVDNARKSGVSDTRLYMQAGNAVSVPVIEAILVHLTDALVCHESDGSSVV